MGKNEPVYLNDSESCLVKEEGGKAPDALEGVMTPPDVAVSAGARPARKRVARLRRVTWGEVAASERAGLVDDLYSIFREFFDDLDRDAFLQRYLGDAHTRLALCHAEDGSLVGFSAASLSTIEVAGRSHMVFCAPVLVRLGYRAGAEVAFFGLTEALSVKLRNPRASLAYLSTTATPASYALFARTVRCFYPSPGTEAPADVLLAVARVRELRGLESVGGLPWVVQSGRPLGADRIHTESSLRDDPHARWFESLSPRWLDGEALLVWIPLDLRNITGGIARASLAMVRARWR